MVTAMNTAAFTGEYRTEFSITGPEQAESPLFEQVCALVRNRVEDLQGDRELLEESGEVEELAYQRFQIELPHGRNPDFRLRLTVKLSAIGGPVAVAVQSAFIETGKPPPPELIAGPPRLVLDLFRDFECYNGPDSLSTLPVRLAQEDAAEFASRIFDPTRRLPILAVSENWRRQMPINPNWLQQILVGLAQVVTYNGDTADELRHLVGFQLACFNGAMRLYQPGCNRDDRRELHRFWMPADAGAFLRRPAGIVARELSSHLPDVIDNREYESVRGQVQQKHMTERAAKLLARPLRQRITELESEVESLNRRLAERGRDAATGLAELHTLRQQLTQRDQELERIRQQLDQSVHREAEYEPEIARLHRQQAERDERIESLRQQLESAIIQTGAGESEVTQLHSRLLERDSQLESLWEELEKAARKESEAAQEVALLHTRIRESDAQVESLRQQLEVASSEAGTSRQAIEQLQENLLERESELNVLRAQLEEVLHRSEESAHLVNELTEGLKTRDADIANLCLLLEGIEYGTTDSDRIIAELRRELLERADDVRAISALLEDARVRAEAAENVAAELRRELDMRPTEQAAIGSIILESRENDAEAQTVAASTDEAIAALKQQIEVFRGENANLERQLKEFQEKAFNQELANEDLVNDLKIKVKENQRLRYQIENWVYTEENESEHYDEPQEVGNVYEAIESAAQHFDRLRFLNSAFNSAERYPYQRPNRVYDAFKSLQELAVTHGQESLGMSVKDWMKERGIEYSRHESEATMNKRGQTRWIEGYEMQAHIKIGSGTANGQHYVRIHFCWEAESSQYVIGHVGEHLPISRS